MINYMADWWRKHRNMQATIKELSSLTDAELRDIGIHRSQIESVARNIIEFHREVRDSDNN